MGDCSLISPQQASGCYSDIIIPELYDFMIGCGFKFLNSEEPIIYLYEHIIFKTDNYIKNHLNFRIGIDIDITPKNKNMFIYLFYTNRINRFKKIVFINTVEEAMIAITEMMLLS